MDLDKKILYSARNRKLALNLAVIFSVATAVFVFVVIFKDVELFMSEFSSKTSAIFWMILMLMLGNSTCIAVIWISGKYVLEINEIDKNNIEVIIWRFLLSNKRIILPITILNKTTYKKGALKYSGTPNVNAPWLKIITLGNKILIIDLQGEFYSKHLI